MESAEPRRLYEPGFEGWDISLACIFTDYVITVIGLLCAFLLYVAYKDKWPSIEMLSASFVLFSVAEAMSYGFVGLAHHLLNSYYMSGELLSKTWGDGNWRWMIAWTIAMILGPIASSFGLCMSLADAEIGRGCTCRTCTRWECTRWGASFVKVVGALVSIWEVYMCATDVDRSSAMAFYWSLFTSAAGLILTFRLGTRSSDVWLQAAGWISRIGGYVLLITVPASCKGGAGEPECIYAKDFNHNAIFHVLLAVSLVLIFICVDFRSAVKVHRILVEEHDKTGPCPKELVRAAARSNSESPNLRASATLQAFRDKAKLAESLAISMARVIRRERCALRIDVARMKPDKAFFLMAFPARLCLDGLYRVGV